MATMRTMLFFTNPWRGTFHVGRAGSSRSGRPSESEHERDIPPIYLHAIALLRESALGFGSRGRGLPRNDPDAGLPSRAHEGAGRLRPGAALDVGRSDRRRVGRDHRLYRLARRRAGALARRSGAARGGHRMGGVPGSRGGRDDAARLVLPPLPPPEVARARLVTRGAVLGAARVSAAAASGRADPRALSRRSTQSRPRATSNACSPRSKE